MYERKNAKVTGVAILGHKDEVCALTLNGVDMLKTFNVTDIKIHKANQELFTVTLEMEVDLLEVDITRADLDIRPIILKDMEIAKALYEKLKEQFG